MTDEEKAIDITSKIFELEKDKVEWFLSTYKNSRMSEIHTFYNGVLKGLAEGRKEGYEQGVLKDCLKVSCPNCTPSIENYCIDCEYANFIIDKDNQISKLEKEISVLLSCSNCQENKGGYVCEKEYNDKCLAQKIQYIKELKEENAELKAQIEQLSNDNYVLKTSFITQNEQIEKMKCCGNCSKPCWDFPIVRKSECLNNNYSLWEPV